MNTTMQSYRGFSTYVIAFIEGKKVPVRELFHNGKFRVFLLGFFANRKVRSKTEI